MKSFFTLVILILFSVTTTFAQDVFGKWKTVDDVTGEAKSILEIYKVEDKAYGKVVEILNKEYKYELCTNCKGDNKDKPIEGLVIMKNLQEDDNEWNDGTIIDPESGKEYDCYIKLESKNKIKIRGYIGLAAFGRSQYWYRVE